jgi:hypothetical protein
MPSTSIIHSLRRHITYPSTYPTNDSRLAMTCRLSVDVAHQLQLIQDLPRDFLEAVRVMPKLLKKLQLNTTTKSYSETRDRIPEH